MYSTYLLCALLACLSVLTFTGVLRDSVERTLDGRHWYSNLTATPTAVIAATFPWLILVSQEWFAIIIPVIGLAMLRLRGHKLDNVTLRYCLWCIVGMLIWLS